MDTLDSLSRLSGMERAAKKNSNTAKFQLWQPESHPIQLVNNKMAHQKLDYIHHNPVDVGFVTKAEEWKYSSAIDYHGDKGLLEIIKPDTLLYNVFNSADTPDAELYCISAPVG